MRVKPDLTFDTFVKELNDYYERVVKPDYPDIRYGQTLFNCLMLVRPDISDKLRGHPLDPFHATEVDLETFAFIQTCW